MFSISEVAKDLGISTHTLRFYEKEKIITPERDANGNRSYTESHVQWLRFVLKLKETKMPLVQIKKYTALFLEGEQTTSERLQILKNHKTSVQNQMKVLAEINQMLHKKISSYQEYLSQQNSIKN